MYITVLCLLIRLFVFRRHYLCMSQEVLHLNLCLSPTNIAIIIVYTVYAFFLMPIKSKLVKLAHSTTFIIS